MKLILPLFPTGTKMISEYVGVYDNDGLIQYIANGLPIFSHPKDDLDAFRYITCNLIKLKLCRKVDIQRGFHVSSDSITRSYKRFNEQGVGAFFGRTENRKGTAHKMIGARKERIQSKLDAGQSVNSIA